jgi:hypothetical protein
MPSETPIHERRLPGNAIPVSSRLGCPDRRFLRGRSLDLAQCPSPPQAPAAALLPDPNTLFPDSPPLPTNGQLLLRGNDLLNQNIAIANALMMTEQGLPKVAVSSTTGFTSGSTSVDNQGGGGGVSPVIANIPGPLNVPILPATLGLFEPTSLPSIVP